MADSKGLRRRACERISPKTAMRVENFEAGRIRAGCGAHALAAGAGRFSWREREKTSSRFRAGSQPWERAVIGQLRRAEAARLRADFAEDGYARWKFRSWPHSSGIWSAQSRALNAGTWLFRRGAVRRCVRTGNVRRAFRLDCRRAIIPASLGRASSGAAFAMGHGELLVDAPAARMTRARRRGRRGGSVEAEIWKNIANESKTAAFDEGCGLWMILGRRAMPRR